MPDARVTDVSVLDDFRIALADFTLLVRQALTDLQLEIRRAMDWITVDRAAHWQAEARRSSDLVARAKDELAHSKTFKRMGDYTPSCVEEKKAVDMAKRRLEHAEHKVEAVRHWSRAARTAVDEFQGPVQQLLAMLDGDIPRAIALLERMSRALEEYAATGAPGAVTWEQLLGKNQESMAQPAEEPAATNNNSQEITEKTEELESVNLKSP
jgi:hypothetical protein